MNKATGDIVLNSESTVANLKMKIQESHGIEIGCIKLVFQGKIINDDSILVDSWNGKKVMVMVKSGGNEIEEMNKKGDDMRNLRQLDSVNEAAKCLSEINPDLHNDNTQPYFEVFNQNGERINLPEAEYQGLIQGMILHNQARSEFSKLTPNNRHEIYNKSYEYLTRAERSYQLCREELLMSSDNYSILCLDIAWCMFSLDLLQDLERFSHLIQTARRGLTLIHGPNLHRLYAIKGTLCAERVLYVRLQLLEGVHKVLIHDTNAALPILLFAQQNCLALVVDPQLVLLLEQHFTDYNLHRPLTRNMIIRALRAGENDLSKAIDFIINRDLQERQIVDQQERLVEQRKRYQEYGKTLKGEKVNLGIVDSMIEAGFDPIAVVSGCIEYNNNQDMILFALHPSNRISIPNYLVVKQLCELGYTKEMARDVLRRTATGNDLNAALELLQDINCTRIEPTVDVIESSNDSSHSNESSNDSSADERDNREARKPATREKQDDEEDEEERKRQKKAMDDILEGHENDTEAHLDIDLEEERQAIQLYLQIVNSQIGV